MGKDAVDHVFLDFLGIYCPVSRLMLCGLVGLLSSLPMLFSPCRSICIFCKFWCRVTLSIATLSPMLSSSITTVSDWIYATIYSPYARRYCFLRLLSEVFGSVGPQPGFLGTVDIDLITHMYFLIPASLLVVVAHISFLGCWHATSYCWSSWAPRVPAVSGFMSRSILILNFQSCCRSGTECCCWWLLFCPKCIE